MLLVRSGVIQAGYQDGGHSAAGGLTLAGVAVGLVNAGGATVAGLSAYGYQAGVTQQAFLPAGVDTVRYRHLAASFTFSPGAAVRCQFALLLLTDPIGPDETDLTNAIAVPATDPCVYSGLSDVDPTGLPVVY